MGQGLGGVSRVSDRPHGVRLDVVDTSPVESGRHRTWRHRRPLALTAAGLVALVASVVCRPEDAASAVAQAWPPFVLVTGLLLIGLVAHDDGVFAAAGAQLGRLSSRGGVQFMGAVVLVGLVTSLLNLDTSVAFVTPVLIYTARSRGTDEAPLLYGCLLLSNAGSLFLPGSNLTNLIVLAHTPLSGAAFLSAMWEPALAAFVVTALVVAVTVRTPTRDVAPRAVATEGPSAAPHPWGLGMAAIVAATVVMLAVPNPWVAVGVMAVGAVVVAWRLGSNSLASGEIADVVGAPVLTGLFGVAVACGTLGRAWSGPATLLGHLGIWSTAFVAAAGSLVINNLPAASLFAAHAPARPFALLVGLNLGPNAFVTGSLAWILWFRAAHRTGARPSILRASRVGSLAAVTSMVAALAVLSAGAHH